MSTHVPSLPVELVSRILEHVDSDKTLKNVALCSHQWKDISIPHLYNHIDLNAADSEDNIHNIKSLTLLFLRKPELAAHVRHFSIRPAFEDNLLHYKDEAKPLEEALAAADDVEDEIKNAIKEASHSDEEYSKWLEQAKVDDALLALLLPKFTKLETLDLETPIQPMFVDRMLGRAAREEKPFDKSPAFKRLHSLVWVHNDNKYGGSFTAAPFLLPFVTSIYFHRISSGDGDDPDEEIAKVEPGSSSCTHLELKDCRFNEGDIKALLCAPKELRTFIYQIGWGHLSYCSTSFLALREGLEAQKETLEDLWLDFGHDGIEWINDVDNTTPFASFKDFPKLRRLRTAPDFVLGVIAEEGGRRHHRLLDLLPPTLEILHITHGEDFGQLLEGGGPDDNTETLYKAIEHLLEHIDPLLPSLQKIVFDSSYSKIKEDGDRIAHILHLAENVKVPFILQNNHGHEKYSNYDERVERKWGWDMDIEWKVCSSYCNQVPVYETVDLQH